MSLPLARPRGAQRGRPSLPFLHMAMALAVLLALVGLPTQPARAAGSIVVKSLADTDDANADNCTLREALQAIANAQSAPFPGTYHECTGAAQGINTITFSVSGTITVNNTLPFITSNVSMTGPIILKGGAMLNGPIIRLGNSNAIFNVANVTFTKGSPAILVVNGGVLNVAGCSFVDNVNPNDGGAINSDGTVNIAGSNFTANRAEGSYGGGAILMLTASSKLAIGGSVFNGNTAKRSGGAIYAVGSGTIVDTIFNGNIAEGSDPNNNGSDDAADDYTSMGAGALYNANDGSNGRKMTIVRSVFNGNIAAPRGNGGAMFNQINSVVEIEDSSFNGNLAGSTSFDRYGGAIANLGAALTIKRTTLLNNAVTGDGGAIANIRGNVQSLSNVLVVANAATDQGGGIYNVNTQQGSTIRPVLTLLNTTISSNVAVSGGGIYGQDPNSSYPEVTILGNTIIAGSDATGGNCAGGPFTSRGHNLDSGASCGLAGAGDLTNANPNLEAPFFNGGPLAELLSQKLLPGSQAIDAGDPAICAAAPVDGVDQRGEARTKDGDGDGLAGCDIGSYEGGTVKAGYGSTPVQPGPIVFGNVTMGATGNATFTIFSTGNKDLQVSNPQLSGPGAAEFAVVTPFPISTSGSTQVTLSCSPTGSPGTRTAGLALTTNDPDNPTVSYQLICNGVPEPAPGFGSIPAAPGPVSFGEVVVGQTKNGVLTVQESGTAPLAVNTPVLGGANPGDFSFGAGVNLNLPDGEPPFDISLSCTPTAPGIRTATLTLNTNDPGKPQVTFNLTCVGVSPPPPVLETTGESILNAGAAGAPGPFGLAVSPDGMSLYVADDGDDLVTHFDRNPATGGLTRLLDYQDESTGGTRLNGARIVAVSPDGKNVYVTGFLDDGVTAFSRDTATGALTVLDNVFDGDAYGCFPIPCETLDGLDGAYGLAVSPDGKHVYVSGVFDDAIVGLRRSASDGGLDTTTPLNLGANYIGTYTRPEMSSPYGIAISPDGQHLYVAGAASNNVVVFHRNANDGTLTYVDSVGAALAPALNSAFAVTVSPDGNQVYVAAESGSSLVAFDRNPADGRLTHAATYTDNTNGIDGLGGADAVAVSLDGRYVYATGAVDDAVAVFERDGATGLLRFNQAIKRDGAGQPPLNNARGVAVSPDGRTVYATGHDDNRVVKLGLANPAPALLSLSPGSVQQGGAEFTLTLFGGQFIPGSVARWNGADLATQFVSDGELRATVPAGLVAVAGQANVTVFNPGPGGGTSNTLAFIVTPPGDNPVPSIEQLSPQGAQAGGPALTLTVVGSNFLPASKVHWNGVERQTVYISPTHLQAQITASDVGQPGDVAVTVVNPGPGGGTSNAAAFSIAAPGENPAPSIDRVSPASAVVGTAPASGLTVTIFGANFVEGAQAQWNGENRPTTFVSATELRMGVSGADIATPGAGSIRVVNPAPGGGASNTVGFTIGAPGTNPVPSLARVTVTPNSDGTLTLAVEGSGFVTGAQGQWNGQDRTTVVTSDTQLTITISSADYAAGTATIAVINPAPGGGASNELLYEVRRLGLPIVLN